VRGGVRGIGQEERGSGDGWLPSRLRKGGCRASITKPGRERRRRTARLNELVFLLISCFLVAMYLDLLLSLETNLNAGTT
jgi:hypothetical protein